jgi:hypothetical protein
LPTGLKIAGELDRERLAVCGNGVPLRPDNLPTLFVCHLHRFVVQDLNGQSIVDFHSRCRLVGAISLGVDLWHACIAQTGAVLQHIGVGLLRELSLVEVKLPGTVKRIFLAQARIGSNRIKNNDFFMVILLSVFEYR